MISSLKAPSPKPPAATSLIEVIVAMTIFLVISTMGVVLISQTSKASKKVEMEEYLYTEAQHAVERIARLIQNAGIDYEAYYARNVGGSTEFGDDYGTYHQQFFDPGSDNVYGAECTDGSPYDPNAGCPTGTFPDPTTFDYETGQNPYSGNGDPEDANARCDSTTTNAGACSSTLSLHQVDKLFLINRSGDTRTMIGNEANALSLVELTGYDSTGNGLRDLWICADGFSCTGPSVTDSVLPSGTGNLPASDDLTDNDNNDVNFVRFTPENLYIEDIRFYLSPIEDPFKGYNDVGDVTESVQVQPRVTIVLTARYQLFDPSGTPIDFARSKDYIGAAPEVTFQTTIGTGLNHEIPAYSFP